MECTNFQVRNRSLICLKPGEAHNSLSRCNVIDRDTVVKSSSSQQTGLPFLTAIPCTEVNISDAWKRCNNPFHLLQLARISKPNEANRPGCSVAYWFKIFLFFEVLHEFKEPTPNIFARLTSKIDIKEHLCRNYDETIKGRFRLVGVSIKRNFNALH